MARGKQVTMRASMERFAASLAAAAAAIDRVGVTLQAAIECAALDECVELELIDAQVR